MRYPLLFLAGLFLLLVPPAVQLYWTLPVPAQPDRDTLAAAYRLGAWLQGTYALGGLLVAVGIIGVLRRGLTRRAAFGLLVPLGFTLSGLLLIHRNAAPTIFTPPQTLRFTTGPALARAPDPMPAATPIFGVAVEGAAKAYPLRLLAFHHLVEDELGGAPLLVTYSPLGRSGRAYRPQIDGTRLHFSLVGARRLNDVLADEATGSWWQQASGKAVLGPRRGQQLPRLDSEQMSLGQWLALYPESEVMRPDPHAAEGYEVLGDHFAGRTAEADAELGAEWTWVVGVEAGGKARAYDHVLVQRAGLLEDELGGVPIAVHGRDDGLAVRVWDRRLQGRTLHLALDSAGRLVDGESGTAFGFDGVGVGGALAGAALSRLPADQETWHAFATFHPEADRYAGNG